MNPSAVASSPERRMNSFGSAAAVAARAREIAGCVLHPDNLGNRGKPRHGFNGNLHNAAPGNIVEDDGNIDGFRNCCEMPVQSFLRRFVVIGRDRKHRVRPGFLRVACQLDRFAGRIGACARRSPAPGHERHSRTAQPPVCVPDDRGSAIRRWCRPEPAPACLQKFANR